jgi:hypothetical protein
MTAPSDRPSPEDNPLGNPLPLQLDLPRAEAVGEPSSAKAARRSLPGARKRWIVGGVATIVAIGGIASAAVLWLLPAFVRRECVDAAAAHGIVLSIDEARSDYGAFRLIGVHVTAVDVPNARVEAPEVRVETKALRPRLVTVAGADVTLDGPWRNIASVLSKWLARPDEGQTDEWLLNSLVVDGARIIWKRPVGDDVQITASDVHLKMALHDRVPEVHVRSDKVIVAIPSGTLGPWRIDVDRVPSTARAGAAAPRSGSSRMRVAFDPGVPETSTLLVLGNEDRTTAVDIAVPRSPLGRLGIPLALVGLRGKALQVELSAHYGDDGSGRAQATAKGGLYDVEVAGIRQPIDVSWEASATGPAATGLDAKNARLAVGPLVGPLTGMLKAFDDGFRLDLAWNAAPIPCRAFEVTPAEVPYFLHNPAHFTGRSKVGGRIAARASLAFDSRDLGMTKVDFTPDAQCEIALFGR